MTSLSQEISAFARVCREALGLSREQAAERMECCCPRSLARYEQGSNRPEPFVIAKMGEAYQNKTLLRVYCSSCPVKQTMTQLS